MDHVRLRPAYTPILGELLNAIRLSVRYERSSGRLIWLNRPTDHFVSEHAWKIWEAKYPHTYAGYVARKSNGYVRRMFNFTYQGQSYSLVESRVIWSILCGPITGNMQVDHINGDSDDNRIENLRLANTSENCRNQSVRKNNLIGLKGVSRKGRKYYSQIMVNGTKHYLGMFQSPEDAHSAYVCAASRLHGEYAKG